MKSWWEAYKDDIKPAECSWCESHEDIYVLDGEMICEECLKDAEYEDPDRGLTLMERNSGY